MEELKGNLKKQIVVALNLKHIKPEDIADDEPLFVKGLGLDSIDALELIVLLQQEYGIKISDPKEGPTIFQSVNTMADYITAHRPK